MYHKAKYCLIIMTMYRPFKTGTGSQSLIPKPIGDWMLRIIMCNSVQPNKGFKLLPLKYLYGTLFKTEILDFLNL